MMLMLVAGLLAVLIMLNVEAVLARRQRREPEPFTVLVCGVFGIGYFVAMLYLGHAL